MHKVVDDLKAGMDLHEARKTGALTVGDAGGTLVIPR
jgi:hypothetical protein